MHCREVRFLGDRPTDLDDLCKCHGKIGLAVPGLFFDPLLSRASASPTSSSIDSCSCSRSCGASSSHRRNVGQRLEGVPERISRSRSTAFWKKSVALWVSRLKAFSIPCRRYVWSWAGSPARLRSRVEQRRSEPPCQRMRQGRCDRRLLLCSVIATLHTYTEKRKLGNEYLASQIPGVKNACLQVHVIRFSINRGTTQGLSSKLQWGLHKSGIDRGNCFC